MHRLLEFRERAVRDLAWVLLSPPMIQASSHFVRCASSGWCTEQFEDFGAHLRELERDPRPLLESIGESAGQKLGKYFENLIAYWLETSPNFDLLERNLQIRDAKTTYGELDLIVHDRKTGRTGHWEVAAKFYLGFGALHDLSQWVGPNLRDDLGRKGMHLLHNQARRNEHPVARAMLEARGLHVDESFVFLKGYLFHGSAEQVEPPQDPKDDLKLRPHPNHQRAWWRTRSEFETTFSTSKLSWFELRKPNWLASQTGIPRDSTARPWNPELCQGPNLIIGMSRDQEVERGFVTPDGWGREDAGPGDSTSTPT
ncbi:MAG: DUF1853 family protein [Planctomycetota bacterium]|nr:DUF1853 family protein [Planctomycetota bacterium]